MSASQMLQARYAEWRYKNTALLVMSVVLFVLVYDSSPVVRFVDVLGAWGWTGIVIAGIFFTSTFTVAPAALVLFRLAEVFPPVEVALLGGIGAMIGDVLIFRLLKDHIFEEWEPVFQHLGESHLVRTLHTPFFAWLAPVVGALIIASPLPDELGIGLLGIAKLKTWKFMVISFVMNTLGIFIIAESASII